MWTEQLSQGLSIAAANHPQTLNNSAATSGAVDMSKFRRILAVVDIGAVTGGGSLTAKLQQATTSGGAYSDIPGATATAVTASSKVVTIELRADELTGANQFVKLVMTETGSQNVVCQGIILGGEAVEKPASAQDIAAVTQRLVV
jgi:hypothetical protein